MLPSKFGGQLINAVYLLSASLLHFLADLIWNIVGNLGESIAIVCRQLDRKSVV